MTRLKPSDLIPIGEIARRTGLSVSAIRFYEDEGLIEPVRSSGNQRRFLRSDIRRPQFRQTAQSCQDIVMSLLKCVREADDSITTWTRPRD